MQWKPKGDMGMISEPFRVGKFMVNGHLEYCLWRDYELIGRYKSFEECQVAAEEWGNVKVTGAEGVSVDCRVSRQNVTTER